MHLKRWVRNLMRSLQWRLVFIFITITIFLIIPIGVLLNLQLENVYYDSFKNDIESGYNKKWPDFSEVGKKDSSPSVQDIQADLKRNGILAFSLTNEYKTYTIVDLSNNQIIDSSDVMFRTDPDTLRIDILSSDNFVKAISSSSKSGIGDDKKLIHLEGRAFFDYALRKGDSAVIYFRYYSDNWEEAVYGFTRAIIISLLVAILIALVLGYALSKTITVPIIRVMHKAQKIAEGDFDQPVEVKSDDEIGKLTKTFNYMAKELKSTLIEISSEKNKIETILNYMTDGVIAFNLRGEAIHANPAAKMMLGVNEFNYSFNEFSGTYNLEMELEKILYLGNPGDKEKDISLENKFIRVYFAVFTDEEKRVEGVIAVLQDITEQQKLDRMRREFVANVSHELRTPLTSIKSYTETLIDGAIEDKETEQKFLGVINSEADRMTRLVKDLLQLSRLDNQQMQWNMQDISFVNVVKNSVEKMQIEAKMKNQVLECYVIGEIPEIKADPDRIEQVVINVVGNAIKYTPVGGEITAYIGKIYSDVYLKVMDTGIGIPQEDLPRIYERFYRVDKARSREMGGTGLGLSIVKEIVEAHGGTITITSEVGKGTEVTVRLPHM